MKSPLWLLGVLACFVASSVEGIPLIEGGVLTSPGEFQYVVGVGRLLETEEYPSTCGGGIIDEKYVLTAAHCVTKGIGGGYVDKNTFESEFKNWWVFVYANTTNFQDDLRKTMEESRSGSNRTATSATTRRVVKAYVLSEYLVNGVADIAILELESPLNLNDGYLQKLELPSGENSSYEGLNVVLTGFGKDEGYYEDEQEYEDNYEVPDHVNDGSLKKAHFRIVPHSRCQSSPEDLFQHNTLCMLAVTADNKRPDRALGGCRGDSGSPVVHGNTLIGVMMKIGIYGTCDGRELGSNTFTHPSEQSSVKVEYYKDFINSVIGNRHLGNDQTITSYKFRE